MLELERERSDSREQARLLLQLQEAFTRIAVTRTPDGAVAQMLRAAREPLGFERAIFFTVGRGGVEARWHVDGSDAVEACADATDARLGDAVFAALRGDAEAGIGRAGELSAPLVDTRNWYVLCALHRADGPFGMLYVDGHASRTPRAWVTHLVRSLATIAAVSIENSILFEKTQVLATRDPLTGLLNRRAFGERLAAELDGSERVRRPFAYVVVDLDDFKRVNDRYGHAEGDRVLTRVADTLVQSSRPQDVVGRFAGDEFVVLLTSVEAGFARTLVGRLSAGLRAADLSCSVGAACYPDDGETAEALFAAADRALYATKARGKNGWSFSA